MLYLINVLAACSLWEANSFRERLRPRYDLNKCGSHCDENFLNKYSQFHNFSSALQVIKHV